MTRLQDDATSGLWDAAQTRTFAADLRSSLGPAWDLLSESGRRQFAKAKVFDVATQQGAGVRFSPQDLDGLFKRLWANMHGGR